MGCAISVDFLPSATGSRTGTLVLTDTSTGTPQVFSLAGTGITATGSLTPAVKTLAFGGVAMGATSNEQELIFNNTGNSAVKLNQFTASGDFAVIVPSYNYDPPNACGSVLLAASTCQVEVAYSPTNANGAEAGVLTAHSSAGDITVQLTGTAVAGTQALAITPTAANFGPSVNSTSGSYYYDSPISFYVLNTGSQPATFSGSASSNNPDFAVYQDTCPYALSTYSLAPGASCYVSATFTPSTAAAETGTLTLVTSAGTKTITLSGTGVASLPAVTVVPAVYSFAPAAVGETSGVNYTNEVYIYNNSAANITISSVAVTAGSSDFMVSTGFVGCSGQTITPGNSCSAPLVFQPSAVVL
jgi:hypothetical protein